ncbi:hypothetical protein AB1Y20_018534 [Prymnesium parvum]|uniref:VWFA domain-containing protein n=1 Tax=Prymnesium parvum TaxID=97485 RepID=A0AB34JS54_PRYPA
MRRAVPWLIALVGVATDTSQCPYNDPLPSVCTAFADVVLVVDASTSIAHAHDNITAVMRAYVDSYWLDEVQGARMAIVQYSVSATVLSRLAANRSALLESIERRGPSENSTCISCGLEAAGEILRTGNRTGAAPLLVLISDGVQVIKGGPGKARDVAAGLKERGIVITTNSLGEDIAATMEAIASSPSSTFANDLTTVFQLLSIIPETVSSSCTQVFFACWLSGYCDEPLSVIVHGRGLVNSTDLLCRIGGIVGSASLIDNATLVCNSSAPGLETLSNGALSVDVQVAARYSRAQTPRTPPTTAATFARS